MISKGILTKLCQWFKRKSLVICCGIAPVILLSALLFTCSFGYNVTVNGKVVGTAPSKEYVTNLINSINQEFSPYLDGGKAIAVEPVMTPKLVIGKDFSSKQELGEALKSYNPYLEKAYSVKSNNKTVVAFKTEKERKQCYDKFISNATKDFTSYEIADTVTFEYELVPYGLIKSGDSALRMMARTYDFCDTVKLNKNCKTEDILVAYCISKTDFVKLNPKYKAGVSKTAKIKSKIPYIRILCKQDYTENTVIKHDVEYQTDDTLLKGKSKLKTEGKDGFNQTDKTRYIINGKLLYENTNGTKFCKATAEVVLVGTKETNKGTGKFEKPCEGTLSSRYGSREGRMHKGVDICGDEGTAITTADNGVVIYSDWDDSGYGYMIEIDHGNGYKTLYAHCSKLYAKVGDNVEKGDVIAAMGNTGRSTGTHLHFEVIETSSGRSIDPLSFFDIKK